MAEKNLHGLAVEAEQNAEKLATGLAQAGVDQKVVGAVEQCADVLRKIVKALGKGQEETGDAEPPAPQEQPPPAETQQPSTIAGATEELHRETSRPPGQ